MDGLSFKNRNASIKDNISFIDKIEHFYAVSNQPEDLYTFFLEVLGLPVIWTFTDFGTFASGGLSLGNVVLEIVGDDSNNKDKPVSACFEGIAFQPLESAESMMDWLDQQEIFHTSALPYKEVIDDVEHIHWVTFDLDIPPKDIRIFVCDYKNRKAVEKVRNTARLKLQRPNKNPLRIVALREIVLTLTDIDQAIPLWSNLLGTERQTTQDNFSFLEGPDIKLVPTEKDGVREIILEVSSLIEAKKMLESKNILGISSNDTLTISQAAIQGLNITLKQRS